MSRLQRVLSSVGGAAILAAGAFTSAQAQSQVATPQALPSRQELNPATRAAPPVPHGDRDLFSIAPSGPCPLSESALTFTLKSVVFSGATADQQAALTYAYAADVGRTIPVSEICAIRDTASRILFNRGILARVEIPEQRIADGNVQMEVIEAKIVNVRVRGDAGPVQDLVESYVDKLRGLTPFDLNKAQRYLLLASDLPGVKIQAAIRPSTTSTDRGAVDIDVTVRREDYDAIFNVQNLGSEPVGRWGGLVRGDLNSFTRLGEQTSLTLYSVLDSDEQRVIQFVETAHFGSEGLAGRLSLVYGETQPGGVLKPLALDSTAFVGEGELSYPLIRARRKNLSIAGGFDWVDQKTEVGTAGVLTDESLRIFYLRADGDIRPWVADRPLQIEGSLELRKGIEGLGSSKAGQFTLSRFDGHPDAFVVRARGAAEYALASKFALRGTFQAQYANEALLSYEEMPVGDLTIGRGYDPSSVSGDKGIAGSIEGKFGPWRVTPKVLMAPYVFYDAARVSNYDVGSIDQTLTSAGVGVRVRLSDWFTFDLAYAHPFDRIAPSLPKPDPRILVSLTARF